MNRIREILSQHPDASFQTWQDKGVIRVCPTGHQGTLHLEENRVEMMQLCQRFREEGYRAILKPQDGPKILVWKQYNP